MNDIIQKDFFFNTFAEVNNLKSFKEWFFYKGMLFGSLEKWWGDAGQIRQIPHEGLDVGFYKDTDNRVLPLNNRAKIPVMADGTIVEISDDDFLGSSVFVRHEIFDKSLKVLHSVYAHSTPFDSLCVNDKVKKGDAIATIADLTKRNLQISGHLHLSMIWLSKDYPVELLKWQILPTSNNAVMVDPLEFSTCNYSFGDRV